MHESIYGSICSSNFTLRKREELLSNLSLSMYGVGVANLLSYYGYNCECENKFSIYIFCAKFMISYAFILHEWCEIC